MYIFKLSWGCHICSLYKNFKDIILLWRGKRLNHKILWTFSVHFFIFKVIQESNLSNLSLQKSSTRIICDINVYNSKCYRLLQNLTTPMFLELKCMYIFTNKKLIITTCLIDNYRVSRFTSKRAMEVNRKT